MSAFLNEYLNEWVQIAAVTQKVAVQERVMEKLDYKPCHVCGVMIEEGSDPEAFDAGKVTCLYCREEAQKPEADNVSL